jgi:P4 family phage/plasmid primase-like protien
MAARIRTEAHWRVRELPKIVGIPSSLVEKLKPFGPRFIKVEKPTSGDDKSGKRAVEHAWQEHPYGADDAEMQSWLVAGGNYGVVCGEGIIEVDLDEEEMQDRFEAKIETFTVKSGRTKSEGRHYYCRSDVTENGTLLDNEGRNLGNVQAHHKYVVGPGCNHNSGDSYRILKDVSLAWVPKKDLEEIFGEHLKWSGKSQQANAEEAQEEKELIDYEIPIREIIPNFEELRQVNNDEFQGSHPLHGSSTGQNFCVNVAKNCWHCFRCNSGGGPLMWLAVQDGLIRCDQSQKGVLRSALFLKTLELAKKQGYDVELPEDEEIDPDVAKYFEGKPPSFVPAYLAEDIMKKFHYVTRESDEIIFLYHPERGVYTPNGEAHIKRQTKKALGKHLRRNRQSEVINYIVCSTLQHIEETPPNLIALKNGIFDLKTKLLKPFDPSYFILNGLPIVYNPKADCPETKKFIAEVVHPEDVQVLQEISGYSLWRAYPLHKAIMLVGEGANGKSTFLELLRTMLGRENVSTIPLHDLETSSFARSSLYGKLANIYPDLSDRALRGTGYFKMLSGGDTISAEYKFHDRFEFKNYAKLIFSCNKVPESPDDTTAFFRRWIIINFPKQFLEGDPKTNPNLLEKLVTEEELSGFFNWVVEGLERLLRGGKFSSGRSVEQTREQYIRASDPVKAFAMDCIEQKAGNIVTKDVVYRAFLDYCQEMRLPTCPKNIFAMKLTQHVSGIQSEIKRMGKQRVQCWRDISLVTRDTSGMARMTTPTYNCTTLGDDNSNEYKEQLIEKPLATPADPDAGPALEDFDDVFGSEDSETENERG